MKPALRSLNTLDDCRAVVDLQIAVWGHDMETVPAGLLVVSAKRGGILIGAEDENRLVGFVWSMPGLRASLHTQWSHMLAVLPEYRGRGLGEALKLEQRTRALAQGIDLIEWTFDPLQAANAHLNFVILGTTSTEYLVDVYGPLTGPLHRGTPTDRLIAEWWIRRPRVESRLASRARVARAPGGADAPRAIATTQVGDWMQAGAVDDGLTTPQVRIPVPARFGDMQQQATDVALAWRLASRAAFQTYFARGYRAVDFLLDRGTGAGDYLLELPTRSRPRASA